MGQIWGSGATEHDAISDLKRQWITAGRAYTTASQDGRMCYLATDAIGNPLMMKTQFDQEKKEWRAMFGYLW